MAIFINFRNVLQWMFPRTKLLLHTYSTHNYELPDCITGIQVVKYRTIEMKNAANRVRLRLLRSRKKVMEACSTVKYCMTVSLSPDLSALDDRSSDGVEDNWLWD